MLNVFYNDQLTDMYYWEEVLHDLIKISSDNSQIRQAMKNPKELQKHV